MKIIVGRYASLNENAGDVTRFQRPCEKDFRDVTAFIMYMLLHEKKTYATTLPKNDTQ